VYYHYYYSDNAHCYGDSANCWNNFGVILVLLNIRTSIQQVYNRTTEHTIT
jgi:hypothetical protein